LGSASALPPPAPYLAKQIEHLVVEGARQRTEKRKRLFSLPLKKKEEIKQNRSKEINIDSAQISWPATKLLGLRLLTKKKSSEKNKRTNLKSVCRSHNKTFGKIDASLHQNR
jgi:hypothetical protein